MRLVLKYTYKDLKHCIQFAKLLKSGAGLLVIVVGTKACADFYIIFYIFINRACITTNELLVEQLQLY